MLGNKIDKIDGKLKKRIDFFLYSLSFLILKFNNLIFNFFGCIQLFVIQINKIDNKYFP